MRAATTIHASRPARSAPLGARRLMSIAATIALAGGMVAAATAPAHAAALVVDSDGSAAIAGDGQCTLPEAMANAEANAETTAGDCAAGSGADTITFAADVSTIFLSTPLPTVTDPAGLTIEGVAESPTILGNGAIRPFVVAPTGALTIRDLTIALGGDQGVGGGAILNDGALTVIDTRLSDNFAESAGAILNRQGGVLTIEGSAFVGNSGTQEGGAIVNLGAMTVTASSFESNSAGARGGGAVVAGGTNVITGSSFTGNFAADGGAILANRFGAVSIAESTFAGNTAVVNGGAISGGELHVARSTFAGNAADGAGGTGGAGGALHVIYGINTVDLSTFHANDGAVGGAIAAAGSSVAVRNSTFAANSATVGGASLDSDSLAQVQVTGSVFTAAPGAANCTGETQPIDGGANIDSGASCGFTAPSGAAWGSNVDPLLGDLADNGGPTETMLPQTGSPAIDAIAPGTLTCPAAPASSSDLATDQRGLDRPQGAGCDIGSVDTVVVNPDPVYTVSEFGSPVMNPPGVTKLKAGDRLPLKFSVTDDGAAMITDLSGDDVTISVELATCGTADVVVDLERTAGSDLRLRSDGSYQFDLKTEKSWAGLCGTVTVSTPYDGERSANVEFTGGGRGRG